jgi:very-short-patch-repair endonuclease
MLKDRRKHLRNFSTSAEASLWILLKGRQLDGRKFRRQHSIGSYVLDFYCPSEMLAVELDGEPHFTEEGINYDRIRTEYINDMGIRIVRFENLKVFEQPEAVLEEIKRCFA